MNKPKVVWLELMIFYTCSDCNCVSRTVAINLEEEDTLQRAHMHNMEEVSALCIVSFCFSDSLFTVQQKYCSTLTVLDINGCPGQLKMSFGQVNSVEWLPGRATTNFTGYST